MTLMSSNKALNDSRYEPIEGVHCDGFEMNLGTITVKEATSIKNDLMNWIHGSVEELRLKNIKIVHR